MNAMRRPSTPPYEVFRPLYILSNDYIIFLRVFEDFFLEKKHTNNKKHSNFVVVRLPRRNVTYIWHIIEAMVSIVPC